MKIAVLQDDYPPHHAGGAGIIAKNLADAYARAGHTVLVVTTVQNSALAGEEIVGDVRIKRFYTSYPGRWRAYLSLYNPQITDKIKQELEAFRPDIVHAHNIHSHLSYHALTVAARSGARVFLTAHDTMLFDYGKSLDTKKVRACALWRTHRFRFNPLRNFVIRRSMRYVTKVVAVSEALKEALANNGFKNVEVIHNGIDASTWTKPNGVDAYKNNLGIGANAVLFSGRLSGSKGATKLIEALSVVIKGVPDAQLLVVGKKDAYAEKMLSYAQELRVEKNIIFTGWLMGEQLRRTYYAAAVVAVPSLYLDPFPTITLEAMACGKPVIATCFGGSSEVVEDTITGSIVDPHDTEALAMKIKELLEDKNKNKTFGEAGYGRITTRFSLEEQVKKYDQLFATVICCKRNF